VLLRADYNLNTTVDISQMVLAPVPADAAGVVPIGAVASSVRNSMFPFGETLARWVKPVPYDSVSPNPEST
jgi:hypothetical protein